MPNLIIQNSGFHFLPLLITYEFKPVMNSPFSCKCLYCTGLLHVSSSINVTCSYTDMLQSCSCNTWIFLRSTITPVMIFLSPPTSPPSSLSSPANQFIFTPVNIYTYIHRSKSVFICSFLYLNASHEYNNYVISQINLVAWSIGTVPSLEVSQTNTKWLLMSSESPFFH